MHRTLPALFSWAAPVVLLVGAGCRSVPDPAPLSAPALELHVEHYAGSPLAGPLALERLADPERNGIDFDRASGASCRVLFLETMPPSALESLASHTRLVAATVGDDPVLSSALLASGARIGVGEAATDFLERVDSGELGRHVDLGELRAAVPEGATAIFEGRVVLEAGAGEERRVMALHASRDETANGALALVLVREELHDERTGEPTSPGESSLRRIEQVLLDDRVDPDGEPLVLVFPSPFPGGGAFVTALANEPVDEADWTEEFEACAHDLRLDPSSDAAQRERLGIVRTLASAFRALETAELHRSGLLFLASNSDAELAGDLALSAEETALAAFVRTLPEDELDRGAGDAEATGWLLEQRAYLFLTTLALEDPPLPPELAGILLRHTGEAGRFPTLVRETVEQATDLADLRERWAELNLMFLEDKNPGARVRAYDWLAERDRAPEGFDVFADAVERRRVLRELRARREAEGAGS